MTPGLAEVTEKPSPGEINDPGCQNCGWAPAPGELWPSHGKIAVRWIEDNCICGEGDWYGQLIQLRSDQKRFLWRWYEYCPSCEHWHYDEALRGAATGDGKTQFIASIVVLEFAGPPEIAALSPNIPIAAASFEQADLLFTAVASICGGHKDRPIPESPLSGFFEVYDTEIKMADGQPGRIFRVAAVAGTNEGGLPSLFVCDELHEWGEPVRADQPGARKARVKTVITKSTKKRRTRRGSGRVISLSTAGFDIDNSILGDLVKLGRRTLKDPSVSPRFLFDWREAPDGLDYTLAGDRELAVRAASEAADTLWSVVDRVNAWGKPDFPPHEWMRYFANRWVDVVEDSWLKDHPLAWGHCQEDSWEASNENPWVISVDMALKHDSVAVDRCELLPDGRVAVTARIWKAEDFDGRIPHDDVWTYIKDSARGSGFRGVAYDPRYFEVPARILEQHKILAIEFDQNPSRMAPACGLARRMIVDGQVVHNGDPDLWTHVKNAVQVPQERGGFTLRKTRARARIDATIAMCIGIWVLYEVPEEEIKPWVYTVVDEPEDGGSMSGLEWFAQTREWRHREAE